MLGLVYPLTYDSKGSIETTDDYPQLVRQSLISCLQTLVEERVMNPEYGLNEYEFTSANNLPNILADFRQTINEAVLPDFPDVAFDLRGRLGDDGCLRVRIQYQVGDEPPDTVELTV